MIALADLSEAQQKDIMSPLVNARPKGCMYCGQRLDRHGNCRNC